MKTGFKNYYKQSVPVETVSADSPIDIVLFVGEYSPITIADFQRFKDYKKEVVDAAPNLYAEEVSMALLVDHDADNALEQSFSNTLNIAEKNFINSTFFALRTYGVDFNQFYQSIYNSEVDSMELHDDIRLFLDKTFRGKRVEIVFSDSSKDMFSSICDTSSFRNITFRFFKDTYCYFPLCKFSDIRITSDIVKAIALLDYEKPYPENISVFCAKYGLTDISEEIKTIHYLSQNENYHLLFSLVFPQLTLKNQTVETAEMNNNVIMKMIQALFI